MSGDLFDILSEDERSALKAQRQPDWSAPMLATLTHDYFSDPDWIFERKLDGERVLVFRDGDSLRILSRNKKELSDTYPELAERLAAQSCADFIVDGEVVAFDGNVSSFSRLQQRLGLSDPDAARQSGVAVYLYVFDILHVEGRKVETLPLRARKALLKKALDYDNKIRFTAHRNEDGEAYRRAACRKGWEGIIAKRAASAYRHSRSRDWLKFKCAKGQELVIGGFTDPKGRRKGFGALLVGYYEDGDLRYAGKVGTGYDDETLVSVREKMDTLERESAPFADTVKEKGAHFIRPELVGEFGFTEWTGDNKLRHPRFLGLRDDKDPEEVVKEEPRSLDAGD